MTKQEKQEKQEKQSKRGKRDEIGEIGEREEKGENDIPGVFELKKSVTNLQGLGMCLKGVVCRLPHSRAKEYLLCEISKVMKCKTAHDFYYLQNKISWMRNMVMRYELDEEVLELLKEIGVEIKKIIKQIEKDIQN